MTELSLTYFDKVSGSLEFLVNEPNIQINDLCVLYRDVLLARSTYAIGMTEDNITRVSINCEIVVDVAWELIEKFYTNSEYIIVSSDGQKTCARLDQDSISRISSICSVEPRWKEEDLHVGAEGFIFFKNGANRLMDQHQGILTWTGDQEVLWSQNLAGRLKMSEENRVPVLTVVIPNKETVYSEFVTDIAMSDDRPAKRLQGLDEKFNRGCNVILLEDILKKKSQNGRVLYDKTEAYWNGYGAMYAFNYIIGQINERIKTQIAPFEESDMRYFHKMVISDWGGVVARIVPENKLFASLIYFYSEQRFDNGVHNRGHCKVYRNKRGCYKILIFCDSFTFNVWWQFFVERFETVVLAHQTTVDRELIDLVNPDVVISAIVERFLISPQSDEESERFVSLSKSLGKQNDSNLKEDILVALS